MWNRLTDIEYYSENYIKRFRFLDIGISIENSSRLIVFKQRLKFWNWLQNLRLYNEGK